jgi:hypothetical protein
LWRRLDLGLRRTWTREMVDFGSRWLQGRIDRCGSGDDGKYDECNPDQGLPSVLPTKERPLSDSVTAGQVTRYSKTSSQSLISDHPSIVDA